MSTGDLLILRMGPALKVIKSSFGGNTEEMATFLTQVVSSFTESSSSISVNGISGEERSFARKLIKDARPNGPDGKDDLLGLALSNLRDKNYANQPELIEKRYQIDESNSLASMLKYLSKG